MLKHKRPISGALALRGGFPVRANPLPLWPPNFTSEELQEFVECMSHDNGSHQGRRRKIAFEEEFANYCDVRYAVAVNSGTTALDLAVKALNIPAQALVLAADYGHPSTIGTRRSITV